MPRPIHIMHVQDSLEVGGMENGIVNLANNIDPENFRISLCCLNRVGPLGDRITNRGVGLFNLGQGEGRSYDLSFRLRQLYREAKVDIIHTHNYYSGLYGIVGGFMAGVPAIIHGEHGDLLHYGRRHVWIMRCLAGLTDHFVTVSRELQKAFAAKIGIPSTCIEVIPNGVDLAKFDQGRALAEEKRKLGIDPGEKTVGCVGRLVPVKNYGLVIEALAVLARNGIRPRLLIAGDGPCRDDLSALAKKRGVNSVFLGEWNDTSPLYAAMDVFVLSSLREGMSNTLLEAMASGRPVVATAVGGNSELVEHGVTGYLVPSDDPWRLANAVGKLLLEKNRARAMGEAGRAMAHSRFSLQGMVKKYEDMYLRLIFRNRAVPSPHPLPKGEGLAV